MDKIHTIKNFVDLKETFIDAAIKVGLISGHEEELLIIKQSIVMILSNKVEIGNPESFFGISDDYAQAAFIFVDGINKESYVIQTLTGQYIRIVKYSIANMVDSPETETFGFLRFGKGGVYLQSNNTSTNYFEVVLKEAILYSINQKLEEDKNGRKNSKAKSRKY